MDIKPGSNVTGHVQYNGEIDNKGTINDPDEISTDTIVGWPEVDELDHYYGPYVEHLDPLEYDEIDLNGGIFTIPNLYRVGDLTIKNTGGSGAEGHLGGIVYVTGDLEFKQPGGNNDYHIYLDDQTTFVLGEINFPSERCTLHGPGCIVAIGDIKFHPNMESVDEPSELDLIFVISVEGHIDFQPNGDYYGSVAGNVEINLQPGCNLTWNDPPPTLKYPGAEASERNVIQAIRTWQIR